MALLFCVFLCACAGALGFNVDIPSRVVYKGNTKSMFGFTVQSHVDGDRKMILVGAPEDSSIYMDGVTRPGVVYRCEPGHHGYPAEGDRQRPLEMCSEMLFDKRRTNNHDTDNHQIDQKSNQWFGATLASTGRNGPIVACAPRYVSYVSHKLNQRDPVGTCFVTKTADVNKVEEISPCRTTSHGQRKTGVCQAGFSAAVSKDGERLFMGAPGSFYWQGRTLTIDLTIENFNYFMPNIPEEGQLYSRNTSQVILIATPESKATYDDSYMGYSVTVGDFVGNGIQGVAVGVPRGAALNGLVVLYTRDLKNFKNITGSQIGAYFGYSLASGDIDGDGRDDIIIGAPMYTKKKSDGYEHGRVYVVYQGMDRSFTRNHQRTGEISRGRFGLAVASLGDINLDGYGDVAIGAPYGGENGRGVVYIYMGGGSGISTKASQVITAEEISPTLTTFGFSLSGGVDLDNNNYTDLAVGAYKSDSIVFLKSRPVVKVMGEVKFLGENKTISLSNKKCTLSNGNEVACADVMFCLTYDGINVDEQINFEVTLDLDSRQKVTKRLFIMDTRETIYKTQILLKQGHQRCGDIKVYLDEEFRDKLTPIDVKMTYELITQPSGTVVPPVLDQTADMGHTDSIDIPKDCGPDTVCIPDLKLIVTTPTINYVLGSGDNVHIDVRVENSGEDAFEAVYYLRLPPGVTYVKMERLDSDAAPVYCSVRAANSAGNTTLECELGNPMRSRQKANFRVVLEVDARVTALNFDMEANSTNPEQGTQFDNTMRLTIGMVIRAQLAVIGASDPPELHYNASLYDLDATGDDARLGPQVIHKYNIKNEGPFTVEEAEVFIMWPYQTLTGENLMYMLVQPQWAGNVRCDVARHINPDNLNIHTEYAFLLNKEKEAMMSSGLYKEVKVSGFYGGQDMRVNSQTGSQSAGPQYGTNQENMASSSHTSMSQSSNRHYGTSQTLGHSTNQANSQRNDGGLYGKRYDTSQTLGGSTYDFTVEKSIEAEQEERRKALAARVNNPSGGVVHDGGTVYKQRNITRYLDEHGNVISQTETSTEYGSLGHEGEASSSFNRNAYYGGVSNSGRRQSSYNRQFSQQGGHASQSGFVHPSFTGITTEAVNPYLTSAGSNSYHDSSVTKLGDEDDELEGFAVNAAYNPNNEFRIGMGEVSGGSGQYSAGVSGASQTGMRQGHYAGGYQGTSASQAGGGYHSSSSTGYSYSGSESHSYGYGSSTHPRSRRRREDQVNPELKDILHKCEEKYKCEVMRCTIGRLVKDQEIWLALKSRINASVLNEIAKDRSVILSTLAAARVSRLPISGASAGAAWVRAEAKTVVAPQLEAPGVGGVPLWVIILAAVVGALLLLLLIFALYKCGFFKRNRPSDHAERQPLNGRDEHL